MLDYLGENWIAVVALALAIPSAGAELYRLLHRRRLKVALTTVTVGRSAPGGGIENRCHLAVAVASINGSNGIETIRIVREDGKEVSMRPASTVIPQATAPPSVTDVFGFRCVLSEGETRTWEIDVETDTLGPLAKAVQTAARTPTTTESFRAIVTTVDGRTYKSNAASLWPPMLFPPDQ